MGKPDIKRMSIEYELQQLDITYGCIINKLNEEFAKVHDEIRYIKFSVDRIKKQLSPVDNSIKHDSGFDDKVNESTEKSMIEAALKIHEELNKHKKTKCPNGHSYHWSDRHKHYYCGNLQCQHIIKTTAEAGPKDRMPSGCETRGEECEMDVFARRRSPPRCLKCFSPM